MKLLRFILFPVVPVYYVITWLRNWLYDKDYKPSKSYDFPIICVGNLSTGGTGKTPMIGYLLDILKSNKKIATLSRGYKRKTTGFVLADKNCNASDIGDEPYQFYKTFSSVYVAVDENRQHGINELRNLQTQPEVILLDDAFQHRKVKAGLNILLTTYSNLYSKDIVLPTGNLREPRRGANRAQIIVVTKCPNNLSQLQKSAIERGLKLRPHQALFFSSITYSRDVISTKNKLELKSLPKFTLVTGIANANPLVAYLNTLNLDFEHLEFNDHYDFSEKDISNFNSKTLILTTQKDYMRLSEHKTLKTDLYYLPITIDIDKQAEFNTLVKTFVG